MSFEKTRLFSSFEENEEFEAQRTEKQEYSEEERNLDCGLSKEVINDLDAARCTGEELFLSRIGSKFASDVEQALPKICHELDTDTNDWELLVSPIKKIIISEFTGNFEELLSMLDKFKSVSSVQVQSMVSINKILITSNHRVSYTLEINRCSAFALDIEKDLILPKIKIRKSLLDNIGMFGSVSVITGIEEWFEGITASGNTHYLPLVEFYAEKRFNSVYIFNKVFGTKLRSLNNINCSIDYYCNDGKLEDAIKFTRYGSYFISETPFVTLTMKIEHGDFKTDAVEVDIAVLKGSSEYE